MILFCLLSLLASPLLSSSEELNCYAGNFDVDLSDGRKAHVDGAEVRVLFQRDKVRVDANSTDANEAKFQISGTIFIFKGNLSIENSDEQPQLIDQEVNFQTNGIGQLKEYHHKTKLTNCQIAFVSNEPDSLSIPREVEKEFERIVHYGVSYQICEKIGTIQPEDYAISKNSDDFESVPAYNEVKRTGRFRRSAPQQESDKQLLALTNSILDTALVNVISNLKKKNQYKIRIPDLRNAKFSVASGTIFESTGHFDAMNGHFSDLTTLKKTKDVVLERKDDKLLASAGFGLSQARMDYNNFRVKYGPVEVKGKLVADIDGLAIDCRLSVDYNQHPCKAQIERFKISEFGKIKVTVHGLGALDDLTSQFMTWLTKNWHEKVGKIIESKGLKKLQAEVMKFDCERFRPF